MATIECEKNHKTKSINAKKCVTIAFLGVDGTGKSTHTGKICDWLEENGMKCVIIPFHKWVFAGMLKSVFGRYVDKEREEKSLKPYSPNRYSLSAIIKPPVALADNILMYYINKWKYRDYDVIIFDRFICATFIKSEALSYHTRWLRPIWYNIKADISLVLDAPVENSSCTIDDRGDHILYSTEQLLYEKKEYLELARRYSYPVFNTAMPFEKNHQEIKDCLSETLFSPESKGGI